jgi:hypothetical protein
MGASFGKSQAKAEPAIPQSKPAETTVVKRMSVLPTVQRSVVP